jgi:PAS domain S-box-containing protein
MHKLVELFRDKEAWLVERIFSHAQALGYTAYTPALDGAWHATVAGLTDALASVLEGRGPDDIEIMAQTDWGADPVSGFLRLEARRHRERGVDLGMFLGLFIYYRQAFLDCIREFMPPGEQRDRDEYTLGRLFDRMTAAFCSEWVGSRKNCREAERAATLLKITGEKNRYLTFFESLAHPVIFVSRDGAIENLNRAAARLFDADSSHGQDYFASRSGGSGPNRCGRMAVEVFPWLADMLQEEEGTQGCGPERLAAFRDGDKERLFEVCVNRLPDVSGMFTGFSILLQDVTESRKNREMILRAKEELERTFDTISDLVFLVDDAGVIQRANRTLSDKLGLSPRDVVGRTCRDILGCVDCRLESGGYSPHEIPVTYPNLPGMFMVRSNELIDRDGRRIGRVVVSRDVTASEKIRETLLSIESKYKSIFDHAPVGIFQSTPEGTYLSVNETMATMFGFGSTNDMIRYYRDIASQMYVDPADREALLGDSLERDSAAAREVHLVRPDGSTFWGRLRGRVVRDTLGGIMYFEGFLEDVTGRRAARESLARSEQLFRSLAENMSQGLVQVDLSGAVEYCNDHFCGLVSRHRRDLMGEPLVPWCTRKTGKSCATSSGKAPAFCRAAGLTCVCGSARTSASPWSRLWRCVKARARPRGTGCCSWTSPSAGCSNPSSFRPRSSRPSASWPQASPTKSPRRPST